MISKVNVKMELMNYDHNHSGSKRNRMSKEETIYLDSNFLNHMRDDPIYIDKASHLSKIIHGCYNCSKIVFSFERSS